MHDFVHRNQRLSTHSSSGVETKRIQDTEYLSCTLSTTAETELIIHKPCNSALNITNDDKDLFALAAASHNVMSDSDDELFSPYCSEDSYPRTSGLSSPVYPPVYSRDATATELLPKNNGDRVHKHNWRKIGKIPGIFIVGLLFMNKLILNLYM